MTSAVSIMPARVTTKIIWNEVEANSIHVLVVIQGWFNDSGITIGQVPYFSFNNTKFEFQRQINPFSFITYEPLFVIPPIIIVSVPIVIDP